MTRIAARIAELGLVLPGPHPPHDPLDAVVVHRGIARTSGQLARIDGQLVHNGRLGHDLTVAQGYEAARICALNAVSVLASALDALDGMDGMAGLDAIERILTVTGFVTSAPGFVEQPAVVDGASHMLVEIFGAAGRHTRSAIGVAALPRGASVEIEVTVALRDG